MPTSWVHVPRVDSPIIHMARVGMALLSGRLGHRVPLSVATILDLAITGRTRIRRFSAGWPGFLKRMVADHLVSPTALFMNYVVPRSILVLRRVPL